MLWSQPEQLMRKKKDPTWADEAEIWPHVLRSQACHHSMTETDTSGVGDIKTSAFANVCDPVREAWSEPHLDLTRGSSTSLAGNLICCSFFFFPPLSGTVADVFFWWQPSFLPLQMCVCGTAFLKMLLNYSALVWGGILMSSLCCMQPFGCRCSCVCVFVCVNILFIPYQIGEPWYYTLSLYKYSSVYTHK